MNIPKIDSFDELLEKALSSALEKESSASLTNLASEITKFCKIWPDKVEALGIVIAFLENKYKRDRANMLNPSKEEYGNPAPYNSLCFLLDYGPPEAESIFIDQYIKAIEESGISPKKFAKINKIDSKTLFDFYKNVFVEPAFLNHDVNSYKYLIVNGSKMAKLHDFFGIKIIHVKSPNFFGNHPHFEEDFKEALKLCSKEDCKSFARLFSEKPKDWF